MTSRRTRRRLAGASGAVLLAAAALVTGIAPAIAVTSDASAASDGTGSDPSRSTPPAATGDAAVVDSPAAEGAVGEAPTDQAPTDQAPTNQAPTDQAPTDQAPSGQPPSGQPREEAPGADSLSTTGASRSGEEPDELSTTVEQSDGDTEADVSFDVVTPDNLVVGGGLEELELTVANGDPAADSSTVATFTIPGLPAELITFERWDETAEPEGAWVPFLGTEIDEDADDVDFGISATGDLAVTAPTTRLRIGLPLDISLEDLLGSAEEFAAPGSLDDLASEDTMPFGAAADDGRAEEFLSLETSLAVGDEPVVDDAGDPQVLVNDIGLLFPTLAVVEELPEELPAGESAEFSFVVGNETGFDYGSDAPLQVLLASELVTAADEELLDDLFQSDDVTDEKFEEIVAGLVPTADEVRVTCSTDGGPFEPVRLAGESGVLGDSASIYRGPLADGSTLEFRCRLAVAADVPDAELSLDPFGAVGAGFPVAFDDDARTTVSILAADAPAPVAPTPTPAPRPTPAPQAGVVPRLADTGASTGGVAATGLGLVVAGAGALVAGRRRTGSRS